MRSFDTVARSLLMLSLCLVTLPPARSHACSCVVASHEQAVATYAASFRGRVTAITREGADEVVTFTVLEVYGGVAPRTRTVVVRRVAEVDLCPIPSFAVGVTYRVYAERDADVLRVGACNPSARFRSRRR